MKAYLAGPEVFLPDAVEIGARKKAICRAHRFEGLYPIDDSVVGEGGAAARRIFAANIGLIRSCDLVLANLTPFRGVSADVGTAFEVGAAFAIGKPVFAYSNEPRSYSERATPDGMAIEDFGGFDNLMLTEALGGFVSPPDGRPLPLGDLAVFQACVAMAAQALGDAPQSQRRMAL
ncbi:nucleoside 2-deoxyribosyltransferase [Hansschlegelia plantiphila]|uniref:Nucleoside 2-deoxyribosyltransferase n=1 Tax=Hansschlegelia plantiphila TaxID=374655 RepID=A0A9W6IYJ2_9HYPH|nr:nucleoside 2-deoxyribosyltransferase [Hansschlegelia plantiphila]GLK67486.1 nucleoside 2-deoxyribosyltransferase [Hansschlegelia plantiphila]